MMLILLLHLFPLINIDAVIDLIENIVFDFAFDVGLGLYDLVYNYALLFTFL